MNIHFVGICGVSMRALAKLAFSRGHTVTGSDNALFGHDAKNVDGKDLVVYTNAVGSDNCELVAARKNHIPTVERAEYLGEISRTFERVIAVAGCHGKSTATAMLGDIFASGASLHVGVKDCSRAGSNKLFITEACEYRKSFLHLTPDIGVILNIKFDHPDYYKTHADLFAAYEQFAERCKTLVVNADDPECAPFLSRAITFGTGGNCDYRAQNIKSECGMRTFTLSGKKRAAVRLGVVGEHNVYNALAAIAAASEAGAPLTKILPALGAFGGIPRR